MLRGYAIRSGRRPYYIHLVERFPEVLLYNRYLVILITYIPAAAAIINID